MANLKKLRVLILEPLESMRKIVVQAVGDVGCMIEEVSSAEEALETLSGRKKYHLLIADWDLPDEKGVELVRAIRRHAKLGELPVLMLTRRNAQIALELAVKNGISDYMTKPYKPSILQEKIERLLNSGAYLIEQVYGTEDLAELAKATATGLLSQDEIDALLAASDREDDAAGKGVLSQEEIHALLSASDEEDSAARAEITSQGDADRQLSATEGEGDAVEKSAQELDPLAEEMLKMMGEEKETKAEETEAKAEAESGQELDPLAREMLKMIQEEKTTKAEETDAKMEAEMLKAMERDSSAEVKGVPGPRIVTSYDFKHPARVNKDQLRTLENLHDNFARLLSSTFSAAMRAVVDVDTAFVDQTTYREFITSLSNPSMSYQFTLGPTNGQAIIDVAMPLVFGFVDRTFGGRGLSEGVDARMVTPIEIGVINRIIKRVIEDLEKIWEPVLQVDISDIELETNPEFMQITAASEIVILLAFEVNTSHMSGLVSLCYPFFTLESILPKLGVLRRYTSLKARHNREHLQRDNVLRLGPMDVPLVAELGRTKIPLSQAQKLEVGDVIRLPVRRGDPSVVYLGEKAKFYARTFAEENGELKMKVLDKVPGHLQGRYGAVGAE